MVSCLRVVVMTMSSTVGIKSIPRRHGGRADQSVVESDSRYCKPEMAFRRAQPNGPSGTTWQL